MNAPAQTAAGLLRLPATWRRESRERYQRWADDGRVTQADVDEIEAKLVWFRAWRNYFVTTGGKDETEELARPA